MNFEETIKNKIKLFTKERYFPFFSKLLIDAQSNLNKNRNYKLLTNNLDDLESINTNKNIYKKENNKSLWYKLMKILLYSNDEFNPNILYYKYLNKLSNKIIKQLIPISIKFKKKLIECVKIYLELCEEKIYSKKKITKELSYIKKEAKNVFLKRLTTLIKIPLTRSILKREETKNIIGDKKTISKSMSQKNKITDLKNNKNNTFLYCNSFTHLFIGETDEESVKQRYLSNIIVKNEQKLNIHGSYVDLSAGYLKQLYQKINKQNQIRETNPNPENESNKKLLEIQKIFKKDYRKIECLRKKEQIKVQENNINNKKIILSYKENKQPKFLYPSIINYKKINNNLMKNKTTINKPFILNKQLKKNYINEYDLYSNINNKTNIVNTLKKYYNLNNLSSHKKYLSNDNSLNTTIAKDKKLKIKQDKYYFDSILENKDNTFKKNLIFEYSSISGNKDSNGFNKNIKNKIIFKNFLDKKDFFFEGL